MNSSMYIDEGSTKPGHHVGVEDFDPLVQVFARVHGVSSGGLSQEEIILRTIEIIGSPGYGIDKGLAKMYLSAVIQSGSVDRFADMVVQAANEVFGIHFNSVEEVDIVLGD